MKNKKRSKEEILLLEIISQYLHNPQNNTVEKTVFYHDRENKFDRDYKSYEIKITAQVREFVDN